MTTSIDPESSIETEIKVFRDSPFSDLVDAHAEVAVLSAEGVCILPVNLDPAVSTIAVDTAIGRVDMFANTAGEAEANEGVFSVEAVDFQGLLESIRLSMQTLAAAAYLEGRIDQVQDYVGSNAPRFVRARDLRPIIERALDADFLEISENPTVTAAWFRAQRGKLKEVNGVNE